MTSWSTFLRAEWDRVAGWALIALAAVAIFLAYRGVADATLVAQQLSYIASGGLGGLLLGAVGVGLLVSADVHDEWRKLDRIAELLGDADGDSGDASVSTERGGVTIAAAVGTVLAAALVLLGWSRAADAVTYEGALSGVGWSATGTSIAVALVAGCLVLTRGRLATRKATVLARIEVTPAPMPDTSGKVAVPRSGRRYHRPDCAVVASVPTRLVSQRRVRAGLEPCGLCHPE
jgi:hypothetical protein